jgi:hypothetical protein
MRIEMDQSARLVEIDILGQPVKRARVIVLYVNRQNIRYREWGTGGNQQRRRAQHECSRRHRAP